MNMDVLNSQGYMKEQNSLFSSVLMSSTSQMVKEETNGKIFQLDDFAKDWNSIYVYPSHLDSGIVTKGMRKVTKPTLVLASHKSSMAFIMASNENPIFLFSSFQRINSFGYILLFELKPQILPDYIYYMGKYDSWLRITKEIDEWDKYRNVYSDNIFWGWKDVGTCSFDGISENRLKSEDVFFSSMLDYKIFVPTLSVQKQRIDDAKSIEKTFHDKIAEDKRKFEQKEWLNEAHIRNSKHRLSNEIMPLQMAVERLYKFFQNNSDGVKLSDIIGKSTNQNVDSLLNDMLISVDNIGHEIESLTKTENIGDSEQIINVSKFLSDYCDTVETKYVHLFKVEKIGFDACCQIKISPKSFLELLDNVVGNAVRHGFIKKTNDYLIQMSIEVLDDKICQISIANNGEPMWERAKSTYFEQGSFAGPTGHTGIGGYRIFEICNKANGEVLAPYSKKDFPVVISMKFPIM